ncbi:hypothetical protein FQA39_LY09035 [Lamprigera yunnana]|nr:hypothetical protein FQA39_LY09035 [Lamprigera yunnana]
MYTTLIVLLLVSGVIHCAGPITCARENEEYACGSACQSTCENPTGCPIVNIKCNDACYCKPNFLRNSNGDCVPWEEC